MQYIRIVPIDVLERHFTRCAVLTRHVETLVLVEVGINPPLSQIVTSNWICFDNDLLAMSGIIDDAEACLFAMRMKPKHMPTRSDELEAFKRDIDLRDYAASQGYELDRRASSPNSAAMRHANGDKIIIGMGTDNHWIFCSVRDSTDNGSIIDFVQNRQSCNLGETRKILRPVLDRPLPPALPNNRARPKPVSIDIKAVQERYAAASPITGEIPYLTTHRAIPAAIYLHPKFAGRLKVDDRGNVLIPHWRQKGDLCGYELKNKGFTGFAPGGIKRLFGSGTAQADTQLIICETGIDALSYAALFGIDNKRFVSTAGSMNPHQPTLLRSAMSKMSPGSEIINAVDHDDGGDALHEQIEAIYLALEQPGVVFRRHSPSEPGQDWNDVLQARTGKEPSCPDYAR